MVYDRRTFARGFRVTPAIDKMLEELESSGLYLDRSEAIRSAIRLLYDKESKRFNKEVY